MPSDFYQLKVQAPDGASWRRHIAKKQAMEAIFEGGLPNGFNDRLPVLDYKPDTPHPSVDAVRGSGSLD